MKPLILIFLISICFYNISGNVLVVEGKFQNKNLFIQNSYGGVGVGYCTTEVKVNGRITHDEVNSSAFEIDFAALNIKPGQNVLIEIIHKNDCVPVILNLEVLKARPTYEIVNMNINATGILKWTTKNETGSLPFILEQFKWNKWVYVGEVQGIGTPDKHDYSFQVSTHSGENKFRIKQVGLATAPKVSSSVILNTNKEKLKYTISKNKNLIEYSSETSFEIYDTFGNIIKKGYGVDTSIENLPAGKYYLCYDNVVTEFEKRH